MAKQELLHSYLRVVITLQELEGMQVILKQSNSIQKLKIFNENNFMGDLVTKSVHILVSRWQGLQQLKIQLSLITT